MECSGVEIDNGNLTLRWRSWVGEVVSEGRKASPSYTNCQK